MMEFFWAIIFVVLRLRKNCMRPLWLLIFGKWFHVELVGLVWPFAFIFENLARTLSPATLGHHRLCCCCGGFHGGGAAVAFV